MRQSAVCAKGAIRAAVIGILLLLGSALPAKPPKKIKPGANPPRYVAFSRKLDKSEQIHHALDRLTFGPRPGESDRVRQIGLNKWLDLELHPESVPENPLLEARLVPLVSLRMSVAQTYANYPPQPAGGQKIVAGELKEAKLLRATYSNYQLEELLVDFWFNHFNVFENKGADRYMLATYEREAIRPHVFGKFYDLLLATAESPAMLFYLDNWQSAAPVAAGQDATPPGRRKNARGLNENYGRELLELHTLGVNGGYTQKDVIEVARCFTGWTIATPRKDGTFEYNDRMHDKGQKVVLGHVIPAGGGLNDGLQVLQILAHHPATAQHISLQLAQRFVADDPPPSLVRRMAETFMATGGDLREVMSVMIHSPEFWSQGAYEAKVKTPFEMVVSALRASNANVTASQALSNELRKLGEPLYGKIEPTGYSNANSEWVSSAALLERMNFVLALTQNHVPGVKVDTSAWNALAGNDPLSLGRRLLGEDPSEATQSAIEQTISKNTDAGPRLPGLVAGLVLGSPEFQKR